MKTFTKSPGFTKKPFGVRAPYGAKRGYARDDAPAERFQATCNECGDACEVPFKPNGKKPVYCRNCFRGKEDGPSHNDAPRRSAPMTHGEDSFAVLGAKIDRLTAAIEAHTAALSKRHD